MAVTRSRRDVLHFGCGTTAALGVSAVAGALGPVRAVAQGASASNVSAEDFFYREDWFGEPWRKPETAVLIHGNAESSIVWYAWLPRMAQEFRLLRPDLPGLGRSRIPAGFEWSLPSLAAYVAHVLDKAGVELGSHHRRQGRRRDCDAVCCGLPGAHPHAFRRPCAVGGHQCERSRFRDLLCSAARPGLARPLRKRWSIIGRTCLRRRRKSRQKVFSPRFPNQTRRETASCSASKRRLC